MHVRQKPRLRKQVKCPECGHLFSPPTHSRITDWNKVDWSKTNAAIARELRCSEEYVGQMRLRVKLQEKGKNMRIDIYSQECGGTLHNIESGNDDYGAGGAFPKRGTGPA